MKRFVSIFLLCVIFPFLFLCPLSSRAFDVQGTEFPEPGMLPPDFDFSEYDYYFLTVSGTPENPTYYLYVVKDKSDSDSGHLYFTVTKEPASTRITNGSFTSYGITTDYEVKVASYRSSTGTFSSFSNPNASALQNFIFDDYTTFSSSYKYIIGCNTDIYSYFGVNVRPGDYDVLNLFFLGGLQGTTDRTEKPTEPIVTTPSGGGSIDLGNIPDTLGKMLDNLQKIADFFSTLVGSVSTLIEAVGSLKNGSVSSELTDRLDDIKGYILSINNDVFSFEELKNYLERKFDSVILEISELKKSFLEFASVDGELKKLAELFSSVNTILSNSAKTLNDSVTAVTTDFNDFADDVKNNVYTSRTLLEDIVKKSDTVISSLDSIKADINEIKTLIPSDFVDIMNSIVNSVYTIKNHSDYFERMTPELFNIISIVIDKIVNIEDFLKNLDVNIDFNNFFASFNAGFAGLIADIDGIKIDIGDIKGSLGDIKVSFGDLKTSVENNFSELISIIKSEAESIRNTINDIPGSFGFLLKKLFIPKEDHFSKFLDEIYEHFGFVNQIIELGDVLISDEAVFFDIKPSYSIEFNSDTYGKFKADIIDFSVVAPYIDIIKGFNTGIVLYFFIRRTRRRLPDIINGTGGD